MEASPKSLLCAYRVICRYVLEEKILEIEIEPGMKDGYNYPFIAEGRTYLIPAVLFLGQQMSLSQ